MVFKILEGLPVIKEVLEKRDDLEVVHFDYSYTGIHEDTDLKYLEITRH